MYDPPPASFAAHVLRGGGLLPAAVAWPVAGLVAASAVAAMLLPRGRRRRAAAAVALVAGVVLIVGTLISGPAPAAPDIRLTISVPPGLASTPVSVRVCASGSQAAGTPPGDGRLLDVQIDGASVTTMDTDSFALPLSAGRHHLRIELVTADHLGYAPPVTADADIIVAAQSAPLSAAPTCPS
jgi:hypothetical protein